MHVSHSPRLNTEKCCWAPAIYLSNGPTLLYTNLYIKTHALVFEKGKRESTSCTYLARPSVLHFTLHFRHFRSHNCARAGIVSLLFRRRHNTLPSPPFIPFFPESLPLFSSLSQAFLSLSLSEFQSTTHSTHSLKHVSCLLLLLKPLGLVSRPAPGGCHRSTLGSSLLRALQRVRRSHRRQTNHRRPQGRRRLGTSPASG